MFRISWSLHETALARFTAPRVSLRLNFTTILATQLELFDRYRIANTLTMRLTQKLNLFSLHTAHRSV